jgi:AAA domain
MFSVGKTVLLGTNAGNTLILRPPTDHTESIHNPKPGMEEWVVRDWDEMNEVGEFLRMEGAQHYGGPDDVVCFDSVSLWQDIGLDDIWEATKSNNPARDQKHAGKDKGEYGRNMDRLSEWLRAAVGLDSFNFCVTAHPTEKLNDPLGNRRMMPWVQGKGMSVGLCGMMTMVAYYEVRFDDQGAPYRLLHTESTEDFYCKNQYAAVGQPWKPLKNPDMPFLTGKIKEARAGRSTGAAKPRRRRKGA